MFKYKYSVTYLMDLQKTIIFQQAEWVGSERYKREQNSFVRPLRAKLEVKSFERLESFFLQPQSRSVYCLFDDKREPY